MDPNIHDNIEHSQPHTYIRIQPQMQPPVTSASQQYRRMQPLQPPAPQQYISIRPPQPPTPQQYIPIRPPPHVPQQYIHIRPPQSPAQSPAQSRLLASQQYIPIQPPRSFMTLAPPKSYMSQSVPQPVPQPVPLTPQSLSFTPLVPQSVPRAPQSVSFTPQSLSFTPLAPQSVPQPVPQPVPLAPQSLSFTSLVPQSVPRAPQSVSFTPQSLSFTPLAPQSVPLVPQSAPLVPQPVPQVTPEQQMSAIYKHEEELLHTYISAFINNRVGMLEDAYNTNIIVFNKLIEWCELYHYGPELSAALETIINSKISNRIDDFMFFIKNLLNTAPIALHSINDTTWNRISRLLSMKTEIKIIYDMTVISKIVKILIRYIIERILSGDDSFELMIYTLNKPPYPIFDSISSLLHFETLSQRLEYINICADFIDKIKNMFMEGSARYDHPNCINTETLELQDIYSIPPPFIFEYTSGNTTWCFSVEDLNGLIGSASLNNPYTSEPFEQKWIDGARRRLKGNLPVSHIKLSSLWLTLDCNSYVAQHDVKIQLRRKLFYNTGFVVKDMPTYTRYCNNYINALDTASRILIKNGSFKQYVEDHIIPLKYPEGFERVPIREQIKLMLQIIQAYQFLSNDDKAQLTRFLTNKVR